LLHAPALGIRTFYRLLGSLFSREGSRIQTRARAWEYWHEHQPEPDLTPQSVAEQTAAGIELFPDLAKYWPSPVSHA
jgi:hypothetical protein